MQSSSWAAERVVRSRPSGWGASWAARWRKEERGGGCWAASSGPRSGRGGRNRAGKFLELGWKMKNRSFSNSNSFLILVFKSKTNSNQIQVCFQIYFPKKMHNFVRLSKINFTIFFKSSYFQFFFSFISKPFLISFQTNFNHFDFSIKTIHPIKSNAMASMLKHVATL